MNCGLHPSKILYTVAHFNVKKMSEDLGAVVDEIMKSVEGDVSREDVESNLRKFIDYGVPVEQAKQAVIKKYGGKQAVQVVQKKLGEVEPDDRRLSFIGKIVAIDEREVEVRGEKKKIFRGLIGDETAVLPFTAWKDFGLEQGEVVRVKNASAGEWGGQPRLNFSEWTEVEKTDEQVDLIKRKPQHYDIIDLKPGLSNIEVKAKLLTMEEREVSVEGTIKKVYTGIMGDMTGKIRYTSWTDFGIREGDVVEIKGAYTKSWRGAPQLIFDENATVEKIDEDIAISEMSKKSIPIYKLVEAGGGVDVAVEGVVIEIQSGSGIIYRCPKCNRAISEGVCPVDGEVEGIPDLRIKAVVDDGTGAVNAVFNRETTEKLTEKTLEEFRGMNDGEVEEELKNLLIAHPIHVEGNALSDEYGVTLIVQDAEMVTPAVEQEREELLSKMEVME
ncbi:MAG: hypothetical protein DRN33_00835 [Thermoplasmata archaeon]|nr:MAG: hypothetical protein DRN33_00835 [Thermoplasmata archaeon]